MEVTSQRAQSEPARNRILFIRERNEDSHEEESRAFLDSWEPLIRWLARRFAPASSHVADFAQVGRLTLIRAALKYPVGSSIVFEHYARRALRNALLDEARRVQRHRRVASLPVDYQPSHMETGLKDLLRREARSRVRDEIDGWLPRLRLLVELVFVQEKTQAEAAHVLGLTPARISQLCRDIRRMGRVEFEDLADLVG